MGVCVEGGSGGIRALRLLISGEYAGAINTDLRRAGLPGVEWAGTLHLSWWELREFIEDLRSDHTSSLFKKLRPDDHQWYDPKLQILAEIANIDSDLRMMSMIDRMEDPNAMPDEYLRRYGPPQPDDRPANEKPNGKRTAEEKRAIAQRARMKAVGA